MSVDPAPRRPHPARPGADLPPSVADPVARLQQAVDALSAVDLEELDGPSAMALVEELHALTDRLTAVTVRALPGIETDGRWALDGARTFPIWLAGRLRVGVGRPPGRAPGPGAAGRAAGHRRRGAFR